MFDLAARCVWGGGEIVLLNDILMVVYAFDVGCDEDSISEEDWPGGWPVG
jgi:hypothetical protein